MDSTHHVYSSGGDGNVPARGGQLRPSRELDNHNADCNFCVGSEHHQQYIGSHSSPVHDSFPSHNYTWRDVPHYAALNYVQAPYDFAEYPPRAPQPYAEYGDHPYSYPEQVYRQHANYDHSGYETRQVLPHYTARDLPEYPSNSFHSPPETRLSSSIDFTTPTSSQISTYSSLSNALDGPIIVKRISADVVVPKEEHISTSPLVRSVPPMGMLPLETDIALPTAAASTPSFNSLCTPTLLPSVVIASQTFEVIQDDSAFPSYEKARKRQQIPAGPSSTESSSPFTTEPLLTSTISVSVTSTPLPAPVQKTAKTSRGVNGKDTPRKKLNLACLFCRERKIACTLPSEGDQETRCNQCAKRSRVCQMPSGGSRRGQYARRRSAKETTIEMFDTIVSTTAAVDELTLASPV